MSTPQTFTIPVADGTTITETNGVLSAVTQAVAGGAEVSYSNGVITINGVAITTLTLDNLTLIGGTTYPAGTYLVSFDANGDLTYTPYVAGGSGTPGSTYTVNAPAQAIYVVAWLPVPGLTVKPGQVWSVAPVFAGTPNPASLNYLMVTAWVNSSGAMYLRVSNSSAIPAMSYVVTVQ